MVLRTFKISHVNARVYENNPHLNNLCGNKTILRTISKEGIVSFYMMH
jgi:hypothetical protein